MLCLKSVALGQCYAAWILLIRNAMEENKLTELEKILEEIEKTEQILKESRENYDKNPENYSARLLLMSVENHLADLLRRRDCLQS